MNPISDSTGQSIHVDDYLGSRSSNSRRMVSDSLSQISRRMNNADAKEILNHGLNSLNKMKDELQRKYKVINMMITMHLNFASTF